MARKKNTYGGGNVTNLNGLHFEQETSLDEALIARGYVINTEKEVYKGDEKIGISAPKHQLYKKILTPRGVEHTQIISKELRPDEAFYNISNNTVYIIEKKFQKGSGSVDEKIQTCDFKKKQYQKLFSPIGIQVEYIYVLSEWFDQDQYKDALNYINSVGCHYYYNEIPLEVLNL